MTPKRNGDYEGLERTDEFPVVAHAMRAAEDAATRGREADKPAKDEDKMSLFWRVFGGTILSICALIAVTLYNNLTSSISDLRNEVSRANEARTNAVGELRADYAKLAEARADLIRKDEFNNRMTTNWERLQGLQQQNNTQNATLTSLKTELDGLKERANKQALDNDALRKDTTTAVEAVKKEVATLESIKDRLTTLAADLKSNRDDLLKIRTEVDKNQAYDMERKERRDTQYKQIDESLKELNKGLQECREKLARLEGSYGPPSPVAPPKKTTNVRPAPATTPSEPTPSPTTEPGK